MISVATYETCRVHVSVDAAANECGCHGVEVHIPHHVRVNVIRTRDEQSYARWFFAKLVFWSLATYTTIVLVGVFTTTLPGLPTISDMVAVTPSLAAALAAFVALYIFTRVYGNVMYTSTSHVHSNPTEVAKYVCDWERKFLYWLSWMFSVLLMLQLTTITLIAVVKVTTEPLPHYALAATGVVATLCMELCLLIHRWIIYRVFARRYERTKRNGMEKVFGFRAWRRVLFFNLSCILLTGILAILFAYYISSKYTQRFLPIALTEYLLYGVIVFMPAFHILDVRVVR